MHLLAFKRVKRGGLIIGTVAALMIPALAPAGAASKSRPHHPPVIAHDARGHKIG